MKDMKALLILVLSSLSSFALANGSFDDTKPVVTCRVLGNSVDGYIIGQLETYRNIGYTGQINVGTVGGHQYIANLDRNQWSLTVEDNRGNVLYSDSAPAQKLFVDVIDEQNDSRFSCSAL